MAIKKQTICHHGSVSNTSNYGMSQRNQAAFIISRRQQYEILTSSDKMAWHL
jgi:hypothetical protein